MAATTGCHYQLAYWLEDHATMIEPLLCAMDVEPAVKLKARPRTCFASSVITAAAACVLEAPAQQRVVARRCAGAAAQLRRPHQGAMRPQQAERASGVAVRHTALAPTWCASPSCLFCSGCCRFWRGPCAAAGEASPCSGCSQGLAVGNTWLTSRLC